MSLSAFRALPLHRRHDAMRMACTYALEVWERYARDGGPIEYTDGVVGMRHVLDMGLPLRAIEMVDRKLSGDTTDPKPIWEAYREPITALQDDDLDLPPPIASAYYAIYNLFGIVFDRTRLYDDGEVVIRQALPDEGFVAEWWTRTWDAWASRGDVAYPPSEMTANIFAALSDGDIARAIDASVQGTRLHAVLLALGKRHAEAVTEAARVLGTDPDSELPLRIGGTDAIAIDHDRHRYAAICGQRYIVRDIADHELCLSGSCGFTIRQVAFSRNIVIFAGDATDDIGAYKTILVGEEINSADYGYRAEHLGTRTLVALGGLVEVVSASDREVGVLTNRGYERLGDGRVTGAAFDDDGTHLVTYAGREVTLWERAKRRPLMTKTLDADIWHAVFIGGRLVGRRLLIACRGLPALAIAL